MSRIRFFRAQAKRERNSSARMQAVRDQVMAGNDAHNLRKEGHRGSMPDVVEQRDPLEGRDSTNVTDSFRQSLLPKSARHGLADVLGRAWLPAMTQPHERPKPKELEALPERRVRVVHQHAPAARPEDPGDLSQEALDIGEVMREGEPVDQVHAPVTQRKIHRVDRREQEVAVARGVHMAPELAQARRATGPSRSGPEALG